MKLSIIIPASILSIVALVEADSDPFGMIAIRSGSDLQYASVFAQNSTLYFGHVANSSFSGIVTDCGQLKLSDDSYVSIANSGELQEVKGSASATDGFAIQDGHLTFKSGQEIFYAIPQSPSAYLVSAQNHGNESLGVIIRAQGFSGSVVSDFYPTKNCSVPTGSHTNYSNNTSPKQPSSTNPVVNVQNQAGIVDIFSSFGLGCGAIVGIVALLI
ncbi:hypothetical protein HG535_0D03460 [Zygotorulaspora mrakii]|uniref:Cell wall protein CWP1 n=1 Tax=Zygotorulaspora mrakii TaxID=42260 RepID=A0A7H9B1V6_ZYGMR|nr:uncharacterized protein HG535_0D03460 [Zygotorulaspora mrakii]QLG72638.1 hypothetical protein HG535_0D03460 [Zygotorulaspora mrakii]